MPKVFDCERFVTHDDSEACHIQHAVQLVRHAENTIWARSEQVSVSATLLITSTIMFGQFLRRLWAASCSFAAECSSNRALC
jgi:hypothetical protein